MNLQEMIARQRELTEAARQQGRRTIHFRVSFL